MEDHADVAGKPSGERWNTMDASLSARIGFLLLLCLLVLPFSASGSSVTESEAAELRDEVREMFYHAFDNYMAHAFPLDELRPLSCSGENSLGEYTLTLVDSLDMLALLGDHARFSEAVIWLGKNLRFDRNKTVSVFETTIRVLGGLLSAHLIASDDSTGMAVDGYGNELLNLAESLGRSLLPAFETPTGIPYGSVNLLHGVSDDESQVTSTAGGGTLTLEFGILSQLTGDPVFRRVARNAVRGLWAQRSPLGLVGAHINVFSGEWTHKGNRIIHGIVKHLVPQQTKGSRFCLKLISHTGILLDAGIGTSIDSFYEYLLKAYLLFGDEEYLYMFKEAYKAVMRYLFIDPWYMEVNMNSAVIVWPLFNSLQAFWPGLQVLAGDVEPAVRTHKAFFAVWKRYGFTPEGFNLATSSVQPGQKSYPLRPELIESTYMLYKATRDPIYLDVGRDIVASLQYAARCPCGYCHIADVESHVQDDHMESFFLAETVKYLYLLFDLGAGGDNLVEKGPYSYIFSTEGHLFPMTPEISLPAEKCTYAGSFCKARQVGDLKLEKSEVMKALDNGNSFDYWFRNPFNSSTATCSTMDAECSPESDLTFRPIKGICPRLSLWRRFGIHSPADHVADLLVEDPVEKASSSRILNLSKSLTETRRVRQVEISLSKKHFKEQYVLITDPHLVQERDTSQRLAENEDPRAGNNAAVE